jgi:hypothetical protein
MRQYLVLLSLLLIGAINPSPLRAQLNSQPSLPPSEAPANDSSAQVPAPPRNKTIAVVLPQSLDAKKLKGGETFTVSVPAALWYTVAQAFAPVVLRVMDASSRGKDGSESRIAIRFEKLHPDPAATQAPLHLTIQAIAAPSFTRKSFPMSVVIIDHFPCDPKVSRDGCEKENKNGDPDPNLIPPELLVCKSKQPNSNLTAQLDCASQDESHGAYGYPDLHLRGSNASSEDASTISAEKNDVILKKGTYLILAGPDIEKLRFQQP